MDHARLVLHAPRVGPQANNPRDVVRRESSGPEKKKDTASYFAAAALALALILGIVVPAVPGGLMRVSVRDTSWDIGVWKSIIVRTLPTTHHPAPPDALLIRCVFYGGIGACVRFSELGCWQTNALIWRRENQPERVETFYSTLIVFAVLTRMARMSTRVTSGQAKDRPAAGGRRCTMAMATVHRAQAWQTWWR